MDTLTRKLVALIAAAEFLLALLRLIDLLKSPRIETHLRGNARFPFNKQLRRFHYRRKAKSLLESRLLKCGSSDWTRTSDIRINSPPFYRLNYRGIVWGHMLAAKNLLSNLILRPLQQLLHSSTIRCYLLHFSVKSTLQVCRFSPII